jgi:hypothetical protein
VRPTEEKSSDETTHLDARRRRSRAGAAGGKLAVAHGVVEVVKGSCVAECSCTRVAVLVSSICVLQALIMEPLVPLGVRVAKRQNSFGACVILRETSIQVQTASSFYLDASLTRILALVFEPCSRSV